MKFSKTVHHIKFLYLMISFWTISMDKMIAQNLTLLSTPITLNTTAGEINSANIFYVVSNPANLESVKNFGLGFYSERKFGLFELSNHILVSGFSLGKMKFGFIVQQAGINKFNQQNFRLCLSKNIDEKTALAIESSFLKNSFSKQLNHQYISAKIGLVTRLSNCIKLGFTVSNFHSLNKQTTLDNSFYLNIATGICYEISKQFSMNINCLKVSHLPTVFSGVMKYQFHKKTGLKLGFVSNTNATSIEINYTSKKMNWALLLSFHPNLGITPGTLISTTDEK